MSEDNPFRFLPTLQHMATVKIIGTLLRDPEYREVMKNVSLNIHPDDDIETATSSRLKPVIKKLEMRVDKLPMPDLLKINLKRFLLSMTLSAIEWLICAARNTPPRLEKQYWTETIYELMRHLQWDNIGCIDGQKTLESYVSNRETINFVIWNQLCLHCMEDEITRFSKTFDWRNCKNIFNSILPIYWYQKIYRKCPTKKMYQSRFYDYFHSHGGYQLLFDEKKILRNMFSWGYSLIPESGTTVSAIIYFRNYLKNDEEFEKLVLGTRFWYITRDVILYLLRTTEKKTLFPSKHPFSGSIVLHCLAQLPSILFIDDWISVFEIIDEDCFSEFFINITRVHWIVTNGCNKISYELFEKVWRIYYRRFNSKPGIIGRVLFEMNFQRNSVIFYNIMFKELKDHQRLLFIKDLQFHVEEKGWSLDEKFSLQFSEQILKTDEERKLFSEIPKWRYELDE